MRFFVVCGLVMAVGLAGCAQAGEKGGGFGFGGADSGGSGGFFSAVADDDASNFFATIHAAGHRITATGVLEARSANDFRLTAVTEVGNILFDVRDDWAGIHVMRVMQGMPTGVVEMIARDVSLALRRPESLEGLQAKKQAAVLKTKFGDGFHFVYLFENPGARLRKASVEVGAFDKLEVTFANYDASGRPRDMVLHRALYTFQLTFTD